MKLNHLFIVPKHYISDNIILHIADETIGQNKNPLWFNYRKNQLTASKFGEILAACRKNKYSKFLFKSLENNLSITGVHSIERGIIY